MTGVHQPGLNQEDRLLALAVDLIEQPLAIALDEALRVGVAGAALLALAADPGVTAGWVIAFIPSPPRARCSRS
jgi:hypothetical protein